MNVKIIALAVVMAAGIVSLGVTNTVSTIATPENAGETVYNPEMVAWWDDMIVALGTDTKTTWTEPGWADAGVSVDIENLGSGTYQISLHGIAASGQAITYTITATENGYDRYGPALPDGGMDSRFYARGMD